MDEKNTLKRQFLMGLAVTAWLAVVFIGYSALHKPFSLNVLSAVAGNAWKLASAALIVVVAGGFGQLARLERIGLPVLARAALEAALGLALIAVLVFVAGAAVGLPISLWALMAASAILLRKRILAWLALWRASPALWRECGRAGKVLLIVSAAIVGCRLIASLAPPLQFDALTYHLAIPRAYLQAGHVSYLPDLMFWGMPQQTESLYALAMSLGGAESSTVLDWGIGMLCLLGLCDFCRERYGGDAGAVAVMSLLGGTMFVSALGSGYTEWETSLYGFGAVAALCLWATGLERPALVFAGIFVGLALGTKYSAAIVAAGGLLVILFFSLSSGLKRTFVNLGIFAGCILVTALPWLAKNLLATGNPFYPLLLPAGAMDAVRLAFYNFAPPSQDWSRLITLPWQATMLGAEGKEGYGASIGPLLLGLAPLAYVFWPKQGAESRRAIQVSTLLVFAGLAIWAVGSQFRGLLIQTRLYAAIFPAGAVLSAAGFAGISQVRAFNVRFGNIAASLVILTGAFALCAAVTEAVGTGALSVALGLETAGDYLAGNLGPYNKAIAAINSLPQGRRVLMLWETRGYACQPVCDSDEIIDRWFHDLRTYGNLEAVLAAWRAQGYTDVLVNRAGADFIQRFDRNEPFTPADWQALDDLQGRLMLEADFDNAYELYRLP